MNNKNLVLASLFSTYLISSAAFASGTNYHLTAFCNKSSKAVEVNYLDHGSNLGDGFDKKGGDLPRRGIGSQTLAPGACTTLDFTMSVYGDGFAHTNVSFYAEDASCTGRFSALTHQISERSCEAGANVKMEEHGNSEHFQINVFDK